VRLKKNGIIGKTNLGQMLRSYDKKAKDKAIENLKEQNLVLLQELPKSGSTRIPVFYKLTKKGKRWID